MTQPRSSFLNIARQFSAHIVKIWLSAALALAEQLAQAPAKLLIPRQKYAQATLALAGAA